LHKKWEQLPKEALNKSTFRISANAAEAVQRCIGYELRDGIQILPITWMPAFAGMAA
jgi:hypothetical protein